MREERGEEGGEESGGESEGEDQVFLTMRTLYITLSLQYLNKESNPLSSQQHQDPLGPGPTGTRV